ncbi:MAG: TRAP transporter small permease [Deltaproteobacteria bacterium]|jgi:TRAP-type C4-dicarboxylate transport system permease small subunit
MKTFFTLLSRTGTVLNFISGVTLTGIMLLTVGDVLLRALGRPILGTYEIVSILLAVVIGFSIPKVSLDQGHVRMEFLLDILSGKGRAVMLTFTRLLCIGLFGLIGTNLFSIANEFRLSGEVTSTIQLPFYHIAYGVGVCCFLECLVFVFDISKIWKGRYE